MRFYSLLVLLIFPFNAIAQLPDSSVVRGVTVHEDPRLAMLFSKKHEKGFHGLKGSIYSAKGFRVQIYNGNDRALATQRKIDFLRRFPKVPSYMSYISPTFRLKVGNFKTRADAYDFYQQVSGLYSPCMIVPDIVVINSLRDDD